MAAASPAPRLPSVALVPLTAPAVDDVPAQDWLLSRILDDDTTQVREGLDLATVKRYYEALIEGEELPPIDLRLPDGQLQAFKGDGYHRIAAYHMAGRLTIKARVRPGGREEAIEDGIKGNRKHGKPMSDDDRRKAVKMLLTGEKFAAGNLPQAEIARRVGISPSVVSDLVKELTLQGRIVPPDTRTTKGGRKISTAKIGRTRATRSAHPAAPTAAPWHQDPAQVDAALLAVLRVLQGRGWLKIAVGEGLSNPDLCGRLADAIGARLYLAQDLDEGRPRAELLSGLSNRVGGHYFAEGLCINFGDDTDAGLGKEQTVLTLEGQPLVDGVRRVLKIPLAEISDTVRFLNLDSGELKEGYRSLLGGEEGEALEGKPRPQAQSLSLARLETLQAQAKHLGESGDLAWRRRVAAALRQVAEELQPLQGTEGLDKKTKRGGR